MFVSLSLCLPSLSVSLRVPVVTSPQGLPCLSFLPVSSLASFIACCLSLSRSLFFYCVHKRLCLSFSPAPLWYFLCAAAAICLFVSLTGRDNDLAPIPGQSAGRSPAAAGGGGGGGGAAAAGEAQRTQPSQGEEDTDSNGDEGTAEGFDVCLLFAARRQKETEQRRQHRRHHREQLRGICGG